MILFKRKINVKKGRARDISTEEAQKLFEFNNQHYTLSDYVNKTVVKTSSQVISQLFFPSENYSIAHEFLLNYQANNNYIGFKMSISEFLSEGAELSIAQSSFFENEEELLALPQPNVINMKLSECIRNRRSCRKFKKKEMKLSDLSNILFFSCGVSGYTEVGSEITVPTRNCASAGGLYPITLYFYANNIENISDGLYCYQPYNHCLKPIKCSRNIQIDKLAEFGFINAKDSNLVFIYVYDFLQNSRKYGNQATAYAFIEAGEIAQNIQLLSTALNYGSVDIGGYDKTYVENALKLRNYEKHVIHMTVVGHKGDN
ncbi:SagB/ThcOx family dehydrogenase [Streptococcus suis]